MSLKETIKDQSDLLAAIAGTVTIIGSTLVWIASIVLTNMIDQRIADKVGSTVAVSEVKTAVALNTDAINDLGKDINDLDDSVEELNSDVKDTLRLLAEQ